MGTQHPYYFDYMAATPMDPNVAKYMHEIITNPMLNANPSSLHPAGQTAQKYITEAKLNMLSILHASAQDELIWTSGATEAINLSLIGASNAYRHNGKHIISLTTEHHATLETLAHLKKQGYDITLVPVDKDGLVNIQVLKKAIRSDTILMSICHINNEIGVVQDIDSIGAIAKETGILLHVDAAQSIGKINLDLQKTYVDYMSFSANKCYGPKGIGALYVRQKPKRRLTPIIHGGKQQNGIRSGTIALPLACAMAKSWQEAAQRLTSDTENITELSNYIRNELSPKIIIHGHKTKRIPHNIMISLPESVHIDSVNGIRDQFNLSSAAACNSAQSSHVLAAIGVPYQQQQRALRISLGRWSNKKDCQDLIEAINKCLPG